MVVRRGRRRVRGRERGRGASSSADEVEFQTITSEILGIYDVDAGATTRKEGEQWEGK